MKLLTRQVLLRLENGKTKWPDPDVLQQLATLYELPYAEMVAEVVRHSYKLAFNVENERTLSLQTADENDEDFVAVRLLDDRIAAGSPLYIRESDIAGYMAFSKRSLDRLAITVPMCVRVGRRERSMSPTIQADDVVLLDCSDDRRTNPQRDRIYAVNVEGGATLKRIVKIEGGIALVADNPDKDTYPTQDVLLDEDQSLFDVVIGQAMWWGQPL